MASSGNFCTWNPLDPIDSNITISRGNTRSLCPASGYPETYSNFGMRSGKWYAEFNLDYVQGGSGSYYGIGIVQQNAKLYTSTPSQGRTNTIIYLGNNGNTEKDGSAQSYGNSYGQGHTIGIAFDADNGKIYFSKEGTWQNSGNPANGTNPAYTSIDLTDDWFFSFTDIYNGQDGSLVINAGQDSTFGGNETAGGNTDGNGYGDFAYTPPSGFLALCTANLSISEDIDPAETDDDYPAKQFNAILYTGNATNPHAISGLGFQPDMVWIHRRSGGSSFGNGIIDSSRGVGVGLFPDRNDADTSFTNDFSSFDSDGFTLKAGSSMNLNNSSSPFVAHCWRANGGTTASNTSGDITSTVQANTKAGFSIVTYTGNGSVAQSIGHGLSSGAPEFILVKNRSQADSWAVYHVGAGNAAHLILDTTAAQTTSSAYWGSFTPTTTLFKVGSDHKLNASSENYVAYLWHGVDGFSKFGSYEGNGSADGPFIYTGFRPRLLAIKNIDASDGWVVVDTAREVFNPLGEKVLNWEASYAEYDPVNVNMDILSNGFKLRNTDQKINSSHTFIYMCWGDVSFKYNNTF